MHLFSFFRVLAFRVDLIPPSKLAVNEKLSECLSGAHAHYQFALTINFWSILRANFQPTVQINGNQNFMDSIL